MGQPRVSRRRVIVEDEDEEAETSPPVLADERVEDYERDSKKAGHAGGALGKLKSVRDARNKTSQPALTREVGSQLEPREARSVATKAKAKVKVKDEVKTKGEAKPIYSFFNAATQRQKSSQPPAPSPPRAATPVETIDSDDDAAFAKGSSTAMALRKRKPRSFDEEARLLPPATTQKFRRTGEGSRMASFSGLGGEDRRPWVERFAPVSVAELAVHKRKVADVRVWFGTAFGGRRQRVLVLKGAAGAGKTATVRLLAWEMGVEVVEWKNPAGSEYVSDGAASTAVQFEEFVGRAGRAGGLSLVGGEGHVVKSGELGLRSLDESAPERKQLLLIEEFPNTYSKASPVLQAFRSALSQYLASPPLAGHAPTPIVLVVSETLLSTSTAAADSFTTHRLLGPELLNHPYLDTIEFNPVAPTILTKALESIVLAEARKSGRRTTPGPLVLKHIASTGDIRSAISSLEFLCLRGDADAPWSSKITFTKPKKPKTDPALTRAEEEALQLISNRETSLGIFHAVGKVVYNKRTDARTALPHPPPWLPQHRRSRVPETDIDRLSAELGTDSATFVAALHENYALSCSGRSAEESLDSLVGCVESFSDADVLARDGFVGGEAAEARGRSEMAFQVAARGVLFGLPSPVQRGVEAGGRGGEAHRMFYPAALRVWRKREEVEGVLELLMGRAGRGELGMSARVGGGRAGGGDGWENGASEDAGVLAASVSTKSEMLLERLPYLARIWEAKRPAALEQVLSVTRVRDTAPPPTDEEDDGEAEVAGLQWATDRPDGDGGERARGTKKKKVDRRETEGGGLGIPVESSVAGLVLGDDDIEDD